MSKRKVGILALQGAFEAHAQHLKACGVMPVLIRKPEQLKQVDALILPGGESGALLHLMQPFNFLEAIRDFAARGGSIMGVCAGLILLAKTVQPHQDSLDLLDITVERNAYGRQRDSHIVEGVFQGSAFEMVFIRAPIIRKTEQAKPIAWSGEQVVAVKQGNIIGASFHPEMSADLRMHQYFLSI